MQKPGYLKVVSKMIQDGDITTFQDLFEYLSFEDMKKALKTNWATAAKYKEHPDMRASSVIDVAKYLDVEPDLIWRLVKVQLQKKPPMKRGKKVGK